MLYSKYAIVIIIIIVILLIENVHGNYQNESVQMSCKVCDEGKYKNINGSSACVPCEMGKFSGSGALQCLVCPYGKTSTENRQGCSFLPHCLESYYYHMTTCTRCPNNHTTTITGIAVNSTIARNSCI
jgi:hypothetical protein